MKIVGVVRCSTKAQAEDGLGLEVQEQAIRAWAKANKHRLVDIFTDAGISGTNELADRPGLGAALEAVRSHEAQAIVVYRLDRLARDLVLQEQLLAEVRRSGGDVFSTFASEADYLADDPKDPSRKLIRQILGAVSEYEKAMVVLRMAAGRRRKADKGGYAYGSPPYGWAAVNGELQQVEEEQEVVRLITSLRGNGASLRGIVDELNERHIPTRYEKAWSAKTVWKVLQSQDKATAAAVGRS